MEKESKSAAIVYTRKALGMRIMDFNKTFVDPKNPTNSDSFVILAQNHEHNINQAIDKYKANYILHSITSNDKYFKSVLLLFHKKNLDVSKQLNELNVKINKLIEITEEIPRRI